MQVNKGWNRKNRSLKVSIVSNLNQGFGQVILSYYPVQIRLESPLPLIFHSRLTSSRKFNKL